jgi:hypothetical protein
MDAAENKKWAAFLYATKCDVVRGQGEVKRRFDEFVWSFAEQRRNNRLEVEYWLFIGRAAEYAYKHGAVELGDYIVFNPSQWSTGITYRASKLASFFSVSVFFPQKDMWSLGKGTNLCREGQVVEVSQEDVDLMLNVKRVALHELALFASGIR